MVSLTDRKLTNFVRCEVADFGPEPFESAMLEGASELIRQASNLRLPKADHSRDELCRSWSAYRSAVDDPAYLKGLKAIPGVALRITQVLRIHQVVAPVMKHVLVFRGNPIEVEYGVVQLWRQKEQFGICLRRSKPHAFFQYPDAAELLRWYKANSAHPMRMLQVPLLNGTPWFSPAMDKPLVESRIAGILDSVRAYRTVARPGPHCESCVSHHCLSKIRLTYPGSSYDWRSHDDQTQIPGFSDGG